MRQSTRRRAGFTLIELLVVMGIVAALMAITAIALNSSFATSQNVTRNADQITGWLLSARQMARRDGVPTGVQFIGDAATGVSRSARYIRQPDDYALGQFVSRDAANVARLRLGITAAQQAASPSPFPVQAGDYFEVYGGGVTRQIVNLTADTALPGDFLLTLNPAASGGVDLPDISGNPPVAGAPSNYRIISQPRPISGEPLLEIKNDICIDFNARAYSTLPGTALSNPPVRAGQYEILFGPSGAVIGQGTGSGMIYLWVRVLRGDGSPDNTTDRLAGRPMLITIQTRTGSIATHPVRPQGDPYQFARDGRNSGL